MFSYIFVILSASSMIGAAPVHRDLLTRVGLASQKVFGAQDEPGAIDIILDQQDTDGTFEVDFSNDLAKSKPYPHSEDAGYSAYAPSKSKAHKHYSHHLKRKSYAYPSEEDFEDNSEAAQDESFASCNDNCDNIDE
ncbi:hypothetical protein DSO57_1011233 [Entomophthora muscae]|uniref:Uncharacterized protein n=1 Tax=Entomophthora muscae TaxID=34485 RepID=A0ACC2S893_9FUNG|nr:hypothetical protein DSO57_1011233 [Entomophthora muscae]